MATTTNNGWETPDDTDLVKDGALAIRTLGNSIDTSTGKGLIAWQTWAPTLSGGWANGNGVWTASYAQLGKIVIVRAKFIVGSTTTKGSGLQFSLPVTASANSVQTASIPVAFAVAGGVNTNVLFGYLDSTTTASLYALNAAGTYLTRVNVTSTIPATWATSDAFYCEFIYEAA